MSRVSAGPAAGRPAPPETAAAGCFLPSFLHSLENPPHITAIVRATLLSQSKDQNSSSGGGGHVSREQMSEQLGRCEHRYNGDRKPRQSLGEPIMAGAVGAHLQTTLFLCPRCMINFLAKRHPGCPESAPPPSPTLYSTLSRWRSW